MAGLAASWGQRSCLHEDEADRAVDVVFLQHTPLVSPS